LVLSGRKNNRFRGGTFVTEEFRDSRAELSDIFNKIFECEGFMELKEVNNRRSVRERYSLRRCLLQIDTRNGVVQVCFLKVIFEAHDEFVKEEK